jgi:predicted MFS family arabinose efflux permease
LSWRWIFYVNLPIGVLALFVLAATLPSASERVHHVVDYLGTLLLAGGLSAIVLATSLGGNSYAWGSPVIIGLGIGGVLALVAFVFAERRAVEAVLPLRLLKNSVFSVTSAVGFVVGFALFGAVTYLPLFLQVVKGASPTGSGLQLLPLMGGLLITSIGSGQLITRTGRYKVFPIVGTAVMTIGLYLLSTMAPTSSHAEIFGFMFVLGLGLGLVMQVLVLAVQNAVDYSDLGVATSGATLFRSIGGSLGTAVLGAIFSNRLSSQLKSVLPAGKASSSNASSTISAKEIAKLPTALRDGYLHAFTNSLSTVFEVAAAIAVVAFVFSWLIRQLPLRDTVATGDMGDTFATPRDTDSLAVIVNKIGQLDRREGARELVQRVAARAGVDLDPAACWLMARLNADASVQMEDLAQRSQVQIARLREARDTLLQRGLIAAGEDTGPAFQLTGEGHAVLVRLSATGAQRLSDLLECWRPDEHPELARLIATLAHEFFVDNSALRGAANEPAGAAAG